MSNLVDVGVSARTTKDNPWFARLSASLEAKSTGIPADLLIEEGEELTKVEKRIRLFRRSSARYLCIIEDDAEILHDGWLWNMICRMSAFPNVAIMNPGETLLPNDQVTEASLTDRTQEVAYCVGFCMVIDRESGIEPDVRVQTLDDLWLSLAARAKGWRCARTEASIVRHTKEPFARDGVSPDEQEDRSRWGEGSDYYSRSAHDRKRRHEAKLMVETFGDMARLTLPKELLSAATDPLYRIQDWIPPAITIDCKSDKNDAMRNFLDMPQADSITRIAGLSMEKEEPVMGSFAVSGY